VAAYLQLGVDLLLGPATQGGPSQQHHGRAFRKHRSSTEGGQQIARARESVLEGRLGRLPGEALAVLRHLEAGHRHPACSHGHQGPGHDHSAGEAARGPAGDKQGPGSRCPAAEPEMAAMEAGRNGQASSRPQHSETGEGGTRSARQAGGEGRAGAQERGAHPHWRPWQGRR
jgi:hypothetical protein